MATKARRTATNRCDLSQPGAVLGEGGDAMVWTSLATAAPHFDAALMNLAFVFLLIGYGTKIGLAPLHAWLPDAHAEVCNVGGLRSRCCWLNMCTHMSDGVCRNDMRPLW